MKEKYRIMAFGEAEEVFLNFFEGMEVLTQEKISDTWFFTIKNGKENLTFSIHDNYWQKVQEDFLDSRISKIIE